MHSEAKACKVVCFPHHSFPGIFPSLVNISATINDLMSHMSLSSLTSFQKHTHQGLKEHLRFSSQEPSSKSARWTFLPDTRFSKVKQYTTQKHTMVKTGCRASSCFPFLPGPRAMLRSHPSVQGAVMALHSWQCNVGKSKQGPGLPSNVPKSTTPPLFTLSPASQMQSTSVAQRSPPQPSTALQDKRP